MDSMVAYPLLDTRFIDRRSGVEQVVVQAAKCAHPVLVGDRPWEGGAPYLYGTVIRDADRMFRMWYQSWVPEVQSYFVLYATSDDGLRWEKPELGLWEFRGSKQNNVIGTQHNPCVIVDEGEPDPERRYKMYCYVYGSGYEVWYSNDGLRWRRGNRNPVANHGDVGFACMAQDKRLFVSTPRIELEVRGRWRRAVGLSVTTDFDHWPEQELVLLPDEKDDDVARARGFGHAEIYGMPVFEMDGVWYGLPMMFYVSRSVDDRPRGGDDGDIEVGLAYSYDLRHWFRPRDRRPVIPLGLEGSFDRHMICLPNTPVVVDDEVWLYYGGWNGPHGTVRRQAAVGLAKWKRGRILGWSDVGSGQGVIVTRPVPRRGGALWVNAEPGSGGWLKLGLTDAAGGPLDGFSPDDCDVLASDSVRGVVSWNGRTLLPNVDAFRITFLLHRTILYGFGFVDVKGNSVREKGG